MSGHRKWLAFIIGLAAACGGTFFAFRVARDAPDAEAELVAALNRFQRVESSMTYAVDDSGFPGSMTVTKGESHRWRFDLMNDEGSHSQSAILLDGKIADCDADPPSSCRVLRDQAQIDLSYEILAMYLALPPDWRFLQGDPPDLTGYVVQRVPDRLVVGERADCFSLRGSTGDSTAELCFAADGLLLYGRHQSEPNTLTIEAREISDRAIRVSDFMPEVFSQSPYER